MADERVSERLNMVAHQLKRRGIVDPRVLAAMERIPRHVFVPETHQAQAYADHAIPVGPDQTLSQPYIVALMTEAAELSGNERVLEIGTGTGYQTAVLAELAASVFTIELSETLSETAAERLRSLGYANVTCRCGDGRLGWPSEAPFDAILVTAAPSELPEPLYAQLRAGGALVIPVGDGERQQLERHRKPKRDGEPRPHATDVLGAVRFVALR